MSTNLILNKIQNEIEADTSTHLMSNIYAPTLRSTARGCAVSFGASPAAAGHTVGVGHRRCGLRVNCGRYSISRRYHGYFVIATSLVFTN